MNVSQNIKNLKNIDHVFRKIYSPSYEIELFDTYADPNMKVHLKKCFQFCQKAHVGQMRLGLLKRPYTDHLLMVWYLSFLLGGNKAQQTAALLHDVVEDCQEELNLDAEGVFSLVENEFTSSVSNLVRELSIFTNDDAKELDIIAKLSPLSKLDKAADNFANLWDLIYDGPVGYSQGKHAYIIEFRKKVHVLCQPLPSWFNGAFDQLVIKAETTLLDGKNKV